MDETEINASYNKIYKMLIDYQVEVDYLKERIEKLELFKKAQEIVNSAAFDRRIELGTSIEKLESKMETTQEALANHLFPILKEDKPKIIFDALKLRPPKEVPVKCKKCKSPEFLEREYPAALNWIGWKCNSCGYRWMYDTNLTSREIQKVIDSGNYTIGVPTKEDKPINDEVKRQLTQDYDLPPYKPKEDKPTNDVYISSGDAFENSKPLTPEKPKDSEVSKSWIEIIEDHKKEIERLKGDIHRFKADHIDLKNLKDSYFTQLKQARGFVKGVSWEYQGLLAPLKKILEEKS